MWSPSPHGRVGTLVLLNFLSVVAIVAVPSWSGRNAPRTSAPHQRPAVAVPSWSGRNGGDGSKAAGQLASRRPLMVGSERAGFCAPRRNLIESPSPHGRVGTAIAKALDYQGTTESPSPHGRVGTVGCSDGQSDG